MKLFSKKWISSRQPRKQRKYRYKAPLHIKGRFLSAHLSPELRKKYKARSLRLRKGDRVKVVVGQHKGRVGKVERVDLKESKVFITGIELEKKDGSKSLIPIASSNVVVQELDLSDKRRFKVGVKK